MGLTWFDGGRAFLARFGALLAEEEAAEHLVIARALHAPERGRFAVVTEAGAPLLFAAVDGRGYWVVGKLRGRGEALAEAAA